jgi:hypothetical protein
MAHHVSSSEAKNCKQPQQASSLIREFHPASVQPFFRRALGLAWINWFMAVGLMIAMLTGPGPERSRATSSWNTTSRTQCRRPSISQSAPCDLSEYYDIKLGRAKVAALLHLDSANPFSFALGPSSPSALIYVESTDAAESGGLHQTAIHDQQR